MVDKTLDVGILSLKYNYYISVYLFSNLRQGKVISTQINVSSIVNHPRQLNPLGSSHGIYRERPETEIYKWDQGLMN